MLSKETRELLTLNLLGIGSEKCESKESFYKKGKDYCIRTVTMIYLGEIRHEDDGTIILTDCAWIPDTSRWNEFLNGKKPNEMEPYPNDVIIYKTAILDATELHKKTKREVI